MCACVNYTIKCDGYINIHTNAQQTAHHDYQPNTTRSASAVMNEHFSYCTHSHIDMYVYHDRHGRQYVKIILLSIYKHTETAYVQFAATCLTHNSSSCNLTVNGNLPLNHIK